MNPYDNVGTTRLSTSVHDRLCRIAIGYQDAGAELEIVGRRAEIDDDLPPELVDQIRGDAVALTRATRHDEDVRQGSSVRGAIDLALVAAQLLAMRGIDTAGEPGARAVPDDPARLAYADTIYDAMVVALSGRIHLDETVEASAEAVLRRIWEDHFVLRPAAAAPG